MGRAVSSRSTMKAACDPGEDGFIHAVLPSNVFGSKWAPPAGQADSPYATRDTGKLSGLAGFSLPAGLRRESDGR